MKNQKKGFTITELVIVIAVIAVLAAVLIPTFVSLVRRANESKDIQLVHNLNTALTIDGEEHNTMQDALDAALESGYDVDKINASATGNEILWDGTNDKFCYLKDGQVDYIPETELKETDRTKITYWRISNKDADLNGDYAIYYTGDLTEITTSVSFDAGTSNVRKINYINNNKKTVKIRTNEGDLKIEAPNDTVHHYGIADTVNIISIAPDSYHEHGIVRNKTEIESGHYVAESGADVNSIVIKTDNVTLKAENGATIGGVAPVDGVNLEGKVEGVEVLPAISEELLSKFAGGLGTEDSPFIVADAQQFVNISACGRKLVHVELAEDIEFNGSESLVTKNGASYMTQVFNGVLDGAGHSITFGDSWNDSYNHFCFYAGYDYPTEIKNLTVYNTTGKAHGNLVYYSSNMKLTNVNMGDMSCTTQSPLFAETNNSGGLVAFPCTKETIFENCNNYYNYETAVAGSGISPFISGYNFAMDKIAFINCKNYGTIAAPHAGLFMANDQHLDEVGEFIVENCETFGEIQGFETAGIVARGLSNVYKNQSQYYDKVANLESKTKILKDTTLAIAVDPATSKLVITQASNQQAAKYILSYTAYARVDENGIKIATQKTTVSIELNPTFVDGKAIIDYGKYKIIDAVSYNALEVENKIQLTTAVGKVDGLDFNYYIDSANGYVVVEFANTDTLKYTAKSAEIAINVKNSNGNTIAIAKLPK